MKTWFYVIRGEVSMPTLYEEEKVRELIAEEIRPGCIKDFEIDLEEDMREVE